VGTSIPSWWITVAGALTDPRQKSATTSSVYPQEQYPNGSTGPRTTRSILSTPWLSGELQSSSCSTQGSRKSWSNTAVSHLVVQLTRRRNTANSSPNTGVLLDLSWGIRWIHFQITCQFAPNQTFDQRGGTPRASCFGTESPLAAFQVVRWSSQGHTFRFMASEVEELLVFEGDLQTYRIVNYPRPFFQCTRVLFTIPATRRALHVELFVPGTRTVLQQEREEERR